MFTALFKRLSVSFPKPLGWIITFHFVVVTWMIFRANSLETLHVMWYRLFNAFQPALLPDIVRQQPYIFIYLFAGFALHWMPKSIKKETRKFFCKTPVAVKILISAFILLLIHLLHQADLQPFIYFRF
jgi:hypothetical protein